MAVKLPVRIANCSGFYGDRLSAAREMVEGGPIDVLTGDYLAELTMLILWKSRLKDPTAGYARTFLTQMEQVLGTCLERGIKVVSNAGGLNPSGLAAEIAALSERLGLSAKVSWVDGDDISDRIADLIAEGHPLANLDTGQSLADAGVKPITANAYLGGFGIAEALSAGADIVVCGRVTDASLVVGPAAWWHAWKPEDFDRLAGAVVAGHVIECGPQATGGNYSWLQEVTDRRYPGFPIAEVEQDGSSVITKHADTGGLVSVGTVTAQLLYEIAQPAYANPDAVAHFDTIQLTQEGPDRVRISGVKGTPPPSDLKVALNYMGGYRNSMTLVLTGLDIGAKAAWATQELFSILGGQGAFRRGGCAPGALRPRSLSRQRARHRASEDNRQGPRPQEGRAGLLQRDHGTGPGGICGLPHHHPTQRRERLRGLLADAGAVFGDSAPCRSSRWQRAGGTPSRPRGGAR